jgi:hypothetical protein
VGSAPRSGQAGKSQRQAKSGRDQEGEEVELTRAWVPRLSLLNRALDGSATFISRWKAHG